MDSMMPGQIGYLRGKSARIRRLLIDTIYESKHGHIGGSLSCVEIMVALYYQIMQREDKFILSKGHAAAALYAILTDNDIISYKQLETFCMPEGLEGHPNIKTKGITVSTGSLGNGLGIGAGLAMTTKNNVYVLLGDGECMEGSVWEAANFAPKYHLKNLTAIIDCNELTATGNADNNIQICETFLAFGWNVSNVRGHDLEALLEKIPNTSPDPHCVIALTKKGKGISFMESDILWHHRIPTEEEYNQALKEMK